MARTKMILSCLFLLEAHVLELYYYRSIYLESSIMGTHAYNMTNICLPNALANEDTLLGTQIIPSFPSIENIVVILFAGSS